jgi:hypothetical protein
MQHYVEMYPLVIENNSKFVILNQSASKNQLVLELPLIAIKRVRITKIDLKIEPAMTFLVESIILPPSFLPIVSQILKMRITVMLYHE